MVYGQDRIERRICQECMVRTHTEERERETLILRRRPADGWVDPVHPCPLFSVIRGRSQGLLHLPGGSLFLSPLFSDVFRKCYIIVYPFSLSRQDSSLRVQPRSLQIADNGDGCSQSIQYVCAPHPPPRLPPPSRT